MSFIQSTEPRAYHLIVIIHMKRRKKSFLLRSFLAASHRSAGRLSVVPPPPPAEWKTRIEEGWKGVGLCRNVAMGPSPSSSDFCVTVAVAAALMPRPLLIAYSPFRFVYTSRDCCELCLEPIRNDLDTLPEFTEWEPRQEDEGGKKKVASVNPIVNLLPRLYTWLARFRAMRRCFSSSSSLVFLSVRWGVVRVITVIIIIIIAGLEW